MLDIELDDEIIKETYVDREQTNKNKNELNKLKQQLDKQLKKIIMPKFMSKNYLGTENFQRVLDINSKNCYCVFTLITRLLLKFFFI